MSTAVEQSIHIVGHVKPKEFWIDQQYIDGIVALMHWLNGFEAGGHGQIPGHFELVMMWRILRDAIREQVNEAR